MTTPEARQTAAEKILLLLEQYLKECVEDDDDRWITREVLHQLMKERRGN